MGYTKLFSEIIGSTIWEESDHVRIVWFTMLALKDERHEVRASVPGLARLARVERSKCEEALKILSSPDPDSRSQEHEGRRIEKVDGGWYILNGEKFKRRQSEDEKKEYKAEWMRKYRKTLKNSQSVDMSVLNVNNVDNVDTTEQSITDQNRSKQNITNNTFVESKDSTLQGGLESKKETRSGLERLSYREQLKREIGLK